MRNIFRSLTYVTAPLFLLGSAVAAYVVYHFPEQLAHGLGIIDERSINQIRQHTGWLNGSFALLFVLALLTCCMYLFAMQREFLNLASERQAGLEIQHYQHQNKEQATSLSEKDVLTERLSVLKSTLQNGFSTEALKWEKLLTVLCQATEAVQAAYYEVISESGKDLLRFRAGYAFYLPENKTLTFEMGEGLVGQAAKEGRFVSISPVPQGYVTVLSGLGKAVPAYLVLIPVKTEGLLSGMIEIASFRAFTQIDEEYFKASASLIGG